MSEPKATGRFVGTDPSEWVFGGAQGASGGAAPDPDDARQAVIAAALEILAPDGADEGAEPTPEQQAQAEAILALLDDPEALAELLS